MAIVAPIECAVAAAEVRRGFAIAAGRSIIRSSKGA